MIKQEIHIVGCKALYDILIEIKNHLSFDIFNYLDEKEILTKIEIKKIDIKKSIFLFKKNSNYLNKSLNLEKKQIFEISDMPVDIYSFIEKINIKLIKLRYNYQSKVFLKKYILDLNSREINKDKKKLKLTEKEISTILYLSKSKKSISIKELQTKVWDHKSLLETLTVETHIHRLRKKIKEKFDYENFIISSKEGYSIN